tara:strand:+ start:875 stop:1831 length:957 start_codon:yes stop_codon:yes gene_type:complete
MKAKTNNIFQKLHLASLSLGLVLLIYLPAHANSPFCGDEGVWIQILGAGSSELDDGQASASYLIWLDGMAKIIVDPTSGGTIRFDESQANMTTVEAIALSQLTPHHTAGLSSLIEGTLSLQRARPLTILGPSEKGNFIDTKTFIKRLIGKNGVYPHLTDRKIISGSNAHPFQIKVRNVPSSGRKEWSTYISDNIKLSSMAVHHGDIPAIAWKLEIQEQKIVFAGDLNNQKAVLASFAENSDALVISHAIPETARGRVRDYHVTPSQIGKIAEKSKTRMLILGHRTNRTRGHETQTIKSIESNFKGPIIFANDMECWGL